MFIVPLYESLEYKEDKYPVLSQKAQDIKLIEIYNNRTTKNPLLLSSMKQVQSFMEVMQRELIDSNYNEITEHEDWYDYIRIIDRNNRESRYSLKRSYGKLYSWLKENGYYDSVILLPEEIERVTIQPLKIVWGNYGGISYMSSGAGMDLNDRAFIKELVNLCDNRLVQKGPGTYLRLEFAGTAIRFYTGYIYTGTPMSDELREKLEELAADSGTAAK